MKTGEVSISVHPLPSALVLYLCGPRRLDMPTSAELSERVCLTTAKAPVALQKCQSGDVAQQRERMIDMKVKK